MTFRKSKLIDNRPRLPALNFRGKCRNMMFLSPTPVLCWRSLNSVNSLRKRRPAGEENLSHSLSLILWDITVVSVSNLVLRGIILKPRTCFSQALVWCKLRILRAEDKWGRVCSSCERKIRTLDHLYWFRLSQAPYSVLKTRRIRKWRESQAPDSSAVFQRPFAQLNSTG